MRKHQRYLPVRGADGKLLPHFVAVANGSVKEATVRNGNEGVLRARYEDAAFFWRADLQTTPAEMKAGLGQARLRGAARLHGAARRPHRAGSLSRWPSVAGSSKART